jgi:4-oxalocrotonate tautomerase
MEVMPFLNVIISTQPSPDLARTIAAGLTERTVRILGKPAELISVAVGFVPREHWIVAGRSLAEHGRSSFWLDIKVTDSTNTKDEKARFLGEVFGFMQEVLGPLHQESYILVHDVRADAYGYGGETQERRYVRARL